MRLKDLLNNIREPPPESMVGRMARADGRVMRSMPFVMLIHLTWLFLWALLADSSFTGVILPTLLTLPPFLYLYLCSYYYAGPNSIRMRYVLGVMSLGYVLAPFNAASLGYLIYGFFLVAFSVTLRTAWFTITSSMALFALELYLLDHSFRTILSISLPGIIIGVVAIYTAYMASQQAVLRRSNDEIMRLATLAERERIGRDLHDLLGHTLSVVALKSELARKLIDRDVDAARSEIHEVERVARDALQQVRTAVSGIRSTAIAAELTAAKALLEAQGLKVHCETDPVQLPHDRETVLALSLREAATNIRRHAAATGVTIRLRQEPAAVIMEVVDDGRGGRIVPGNGLNGMRERLDSVGGTLRLEPNKDGGTRLFVSVPRAA